MTTAAHAPAPFSFQRATKKHSRLRLCLTGPTGSGKTYTALAIAKGFGRPVRVIDSERGSARKYSDRFDFEVLELEEHSPATYVEAIRLASEGFDGVLIIDSLSHAWMGKAGALEQVDRIAKRNGGASFNAWREVTPMHNALVDAILASPLHVIVTLRSKTAYVVEENAKGKSAPRKVGLEPVMREGVEYEFDVVGEMGFDHELSIGKTRCEALDGKHFMKPGADLATILRHWLEDGVEDIAASLPVGPAPTPAAPPVTSRLDSMTAAERNHWTSTLAPALEDLAKTGDVEQLKAVCVAGAELFKGKATSAFSTHVNAAYRATKNRIEQRQELAKVAAEAPASPAPEAPAEEHPRHPTTPAPPPETEDGNPEWGMGASAPPEDGREPALPAWADPAQTPVDPKATKGLQPMKLPARGAPLKYEIPPGTPEEVCRTCNATIFWVKTPAGKNCPVDPGGTTHFASCPQAAEHSKKGRAKGATP